MTEPSNQYQTITVDRAAAPRVALITLNRPKALNALNAELISELVDAATTFDLDPDVGAIVITGSDKAFAAGADIKQMQDLGYPQTYTDNLFAEADRLANLRTPLIAAVAGYALGGGCELAMLCDILIAADTAVFGQPEIKLGVIPGIGGSQRLARAVGKAVAMDMILTGRTMKADEAKQTGLASRVVPADELLPTALEVAGTIAGYSKPVTWMAKEAVNRAFETTLTEGIRFERRVFQAGFATSDQAEGMTAFTEKRPPRFTHG